MRSILPLVVLCSLVARPAVASGAVEQPLFSGGMCFVFHPLPLDGIGDDAGGLGTGLGGRLYFNLGVPYVRVGGGGHASGVKYGALRSQARYGSGGVTLEGAVPIGRLVVAAGAMVGGQGIHVHHYVEELDDGSFRVQRHDVTGFYIAPVFSLELIVIKRLKLTAWGQLYPPGWLDEFVGPTASIYVGLLFNSYLSGKE